MALHKQPNIFESMGLAGTTAVIAINFTHPLDVCKTRIQTGNFHFGNLIRQEGVLSFWKGIEAAYLREATYTSIKLGCYAPIKEKLGADKNDNFFLKFAAGSISGTLGVLVGNPFDVIKTIGITNTKERIPFPTLMKQMYNQQGMAGFYRGISANIARACVVNGTKMSCYDQIKGYTVDYTGWDRKDLRCQGISAFSAGFFMTCTSAPFDRIRTTLMNQPTNEKLYNGFMDASFNIFKKEGIGGFYKGFILIWGRFAPISILQLVIYDNLLNSFGYKTL